MRKLLLSTIALLFSVAMLAVGAGDGVLLARDADGGACFLHRLASVGLVFGVRLILLRQ